MAGRQSGVIKLYAMGKGYGFIIPDGGGPDVFFHVEDMKAAKIRWFDDGDRLTFEVVPGKAGPRVANLQLAPGR